MSGPHNVFVLHMCEDDQKPASMEFDMHNWAFLGFQGLSSFGMQMRMSMIGLHADHARQLATCICWGELWLAGIASIVEDF